MKVEVPELKDEMKNMKEGKGKSEQKHESEKVMKIQKDVLELKNEVNDMKRMMEKKEGDLKD